MKYFSTLLAILVLSGCATSREPVACADQPGSQRAVTGDELDSADIHVVNWNIQKGGDPQWSADLTSLHETPDLYVFQEAPLKSTVWNETTVDQHHAFAPGYKSRRSLTGVMTISATRPLTQCNLVAVEPWIRSPKATVITEYGLTDTDETLLVVNIHAVNFTFGTRAFVDQIEQAKAVLEEHDGPILFSGDFNTWRWRRAEILDEMTSELGLQVLSFDEDHRKRFMGLPLDHIYVRGLEVVDATTTRVDSSDHNPMSVRFRL